MDLVTGAMGMLPSKLQELLKEEYKLKKRVEKDVRSLLLELEIMDPALRTVGTVPWEELDERTKDWACEVREASYDMDDVLDAFIIRVGGDGPHPADPDHTVQRLTKKMSNLFDLGKFKARHDIAGAIRGIKKQVQEMSERRIRYKIEVPPAAAENVDPRLLHRDTKESQLVGIDEPRDELIRMLSAGGKELKIVSVVGFAGLGETTLAQAVYDKVNLNFDCWAFVPVGKNPDPRNVLRGILDGIKTSKESDIDKMRSTLVDLMQLDERQLIDEIRDYLKGKSADLDEVSDNILKKCDGVPLAIVTIASVLARKPLKEWSNVYNSIGFGPDGDEKVENMKKILSFSYYDLPCHLRTCLIYLSIFQQEQTTERRDLILRWIAEGIVKEEIGKEVLEIGDIYIHELVDRSMIIPIYDKGSGLLFACRVHEMVVHLIRDLSSKDNFVLVLKGEEKPPPQPQHSIRRLALQMRKVETNYKDMQQLRSFSAIICHTSLMPPVFSFEVLRVLVLDFCIDMKVYPLDHIAKLLHLRYLGLSHTHVCKFPEDISRLKFLQTLVLKDTGIEELPVSVCQLTRLMCLRVDRKMSVPDWIGKLTSLVELEMYHEVSDLIKEPFSVVGSPETSHGVGNKCSARQFVTELGKLTNLRVLKTGMNLQDEEEGRDFLEALRNLRKVQSIDISFPSRFLPMDVDTMEPSFALSSSLCVLDLFNVEFSRLPAWINHRHLPNLCQLTVVVSVEDEQDLAVLGEFRGLRNLVLVALRVHRLKLAACRSGGFPKLLKLQVTAPLKFAHGAMPRLEHINFSIPVAELKDADIGFEFGLENLSSLQFVDASIDCADACPMEVDEAYGVLKHAIDIHPNHPAREVRKTDEDKMGPADAFSRMFSRQNYKILKASTLSDDISGQQDRYNTLHTEAVEVARSVPKEHSCVAKLALLPKQLAGDPVGSMEHAFELWHSNQLIEKIEAQERLLDEYNVEIPRLAAILEELKTALSLQEKGEEVTHTSLSEQQ